MMPRRGAPFFVLAVVLFVLQKGPGIDAALATPGVVDKDRGGSELRDAAIRESLVSISTGKLPPNDDRLVELIAENVKEAAARASNASQGIEAAALEAQEAVSEITAAYTAVIFRSKSVTEAGRLFNRFEKTIEKIVDFAKNGNFVKL